MPMLILLSCAKTMSDVSKTKTPLTTFPGFRKEAAEVALQMSQFSVEELERLLKVNPKIRPTAGVGSLYDKSIVYDNQEVSK